jgi:prepilin-type processing-associated H-X9-DG protein
MNHAPSSDVHYSIDHQRHKVYDDDSYYRSLTPAQIRASNGAYSVGGGNILWADGHASFLDSWSIYKGVRVDVGGVKYPRIFYSE